MTELLFSRRSHNLRFTINTKILQSCKGLDKARMSCRSDLTCISPLFILVCEIASQMFSWYLICPKSDCKHFLERCRGKWNPRAILIWRPEVHSNNYRGRNYTCYLQSTLLLSFAWNHVDDSCKWETPWWDSDTVPSLKCLCKSHGDTMIMTAQLRVWTHTLAFPPDSL